MLIKYDISNKKMNGIKKILLGCKFAKPYLWKLRRPWKPDFRDSRINKRVCPNKGVYSGKKSLNK